MGIDIKKSMTVPFQNKSWILYLGIYVTLCYIPVLIMLLLIHFHSYSVLEIMRPILRFFNLFSYIPLAFVIQLAHNEITDNDGFNTLSFKQNISGCIKNGACLFAISLIYALIMILMIIAFLGYFVANDYLAFTDILDPLFIYQNEVIAPGAIGLLILFTFTSILIPYFFVAFAEKFDMMDAFNWVKVFKRLFASGKEFLISVACILLVNLFTITVFIFTFTKVLSGAHLYLNSLYPNSMGVIPSAIVLTSWIIISAIVILSVATISFVSIMVLYNIMAQVYKNEILKEINARVTEAG